MTQLLLHREDKPSVLDMSEAVIARLQEKAGAPKDKILKVTSHKQASNCDLFQLCVISGNSIRVHKRYRGPYQGNCFLPFVIPDLYFIKYMNKIAYINDRKVTNQLGIALVEGIEFGRLRQVTMQQIRRKHFGLPYIRERRVRRTGTTTGFRRTPRSERR